MNSRLLLVLLGVVITAVQSHGAIGELEEKAHGGHGLGSHGFAGDDKTGAGYGGHKGGVKSTGYNRGFSYGTGHDEGKTFSSDDEKYGGKGYGDKEFSGFGLGGLGYGGLGFGGVRVPFVFFR